MRLLLLSACLLVSACSSLPTLPGDGPAPLVATHISEEGSKRFVLESAPLERRPGMTRPASGNRLQSSPKGLLESRDALQEEATQRWLASSHYCRDGFIVLTRTSWKLRGECNETASAADRKAFPNQPGWGE